MGSVVLGMKTIPEGLVYLLSQVVGGVLGFGMLKVSTISISQLWLSFPSIHHIQMILDVLMVEQWKKKKKDVNVNLIKSVVMWMEFYTFIYHVYIYTFIHIYSHRGSRPLISDSGEHNERVFT